jgi:hypothetical protein
MIMEEADNTELLYSQSELRSLQKGYGEMGGGRQYAVSMSRSVLKKKTKLPRLSPQAKYTDRVTADCRRS